MRSERSNYTRKLAVMAMLLALSVIATRLLSIQTPIIRIGFGGIPIMLAGLIYGPAAGFSVGALADLVGFFGFPAGFAYFPGFTLTSGLVGTIAPLILGARRLTSSFWRLLVAIALSQVLTSLVLDTYWITLISGKTAFAILPVRIINQLVTIPVYAALLAALRQAWLTATANSR